ncbi:methylated-DNA--[protein]-cysteine S-methyltransferase [Corynebacterium sp. CNCTC7651]|uniref:methylated-DNA--[protein]-cysteine S-methyltransferase n=1 Tax=Corynebacterium sp. CNCTC7651 TaxID=2815361 RepID=UPI001F42A910|nr:methylated-DNA--[protein]-cysteine S-methyltransferase [Corynebacterium sp. CNCTC7651]UIZ91814.1 methylated-DNA--[protein]-cysteine S-methyltransferase [Corynebacterium sp. CNCTC7651]
MQDRTYRIHRTPVGEVLSVSTPRGLVRIELDPARFSLVQAGCSAEGGEGDVGTQLAQYFAGERRAFELALDWGAREGFRLRAQQALLEIPYGETATYSQLAALAGNPRAVRAAGTACATNPLPIVVPCHRVVRADGTVGNYAGGPAMKRFLLELEARHG